jgi:hypothetical protein
MASQLTCALLRYLSVAAVVGALPALALIEISHWYETVLLLGIVYLFFAFNPWLAFAVAAAAFLFEILIDMCYARFKWQLTFFSSWLFTAVAWVSNIIVLSLMR